jgi:hypothetical protein
LPGSLLRPVAQPGTNDPLQIFDHGSIGNETQQGLPYWIWRVLPTLFPEYLPGNQDGYGAIGVYWVAGEELPVDSSLRRLSASWQHSQGLSRLDFKISTIPRASRQPRTTSCSIAG